MPFFNEIVKFEYDLSLKPKFSIPKIKSYKGNLLDIDPEQRLWISGKSCGTDLNSELCGLNFIDVIRSLISDC